MLNEANTSMNAQDNECADFAPDENQYDAMHKGMYHCPERQGMKLAQAYVPFQKMDKMYPPEQCLQMGTCFPELSRPYHAKADYQYKPIFKL